jgi:dethiobiotin synthetase
MKENKFNHNFFITGIGTGVGKTFVSALFLRALKNLGYSYYKPIQCGDLDFSDSQKVAKLSESDFPGPFIKDSTLKFKLPVSPHLAAKEEGKIISLEEIKNKFPSVPQKLIIEGAGGVLVPLNENDFLIDLAPLFRAKIVIVCSTYLGSLNHTLLTINEIKRRNLPILGLVFNHVPEIDPEMNKDQLNNPLTKLRNQDTKKFILNQTKLPCLLEIEAEKEFHSITMNKYAQLLLKNLESH